MRQYERSAPLAPKLPSRLTMSINLLSLTVAIAGVLTAGDMARRFNQLGLGNRKYGAGNIPEGHRVVVETHDLAKRSGLQLVRLCHRFHYQGS
jgi:hypothetical protein